MFKIDSTVFLFNLASKFIPMKKIITIIISTFILSNFCFSATFTVLNTNDSGIGSLRQAITDANGSNGPHSIVFNIPNTDVNFNTNSGTWKITLNSTLPMIIKPFISIDATTQTNNQGNTNPEGPEIELSSNNMLTFAFRIATPGNTVKGFIINGFDFGIQIYGTMANANLVSDNYIGTNFNGLQTIANNFGIGISGDAPGTIIRNNLISGNNNYGIVASSGNTLNIKGNLIGTDKTGMSKLPNGSGIVLDNSASSTIGGTAFGDRNIISGNSSSGIIFNGTSNSNNQIINNFIGVNKNGNDTLPNETGIIFNTAPNNIIGGNLPNKANVISGNSSAAIVLNGTGANGNIIQGNFVGTDSSGTMPLSNAYGIIVKMDADRNLIGGTTPAERNIISANLEIGVYIESSDSNIVTGNYIGTNVQGDNAFRKNGVLIQANGIEINTVSKYNRIGGLSPGERNIISGNRVYGAIYYGNSSLNNIVGNYIGTDVTGNFSIPNATGICVDASSNHNMIEHNLLSGNVSYGIFIVTTGSYYNTFRANKVGTNALGTAAIPNDVGIIIAGGAKYNIIGGENPEDRNVFSGNHYCGIEISDNTTDSNQIIGNFVGTDISGNVALGNYYGIVASSFSSHSLIDKNIISGNNSCGMILTDNTHHNKITNNSIGLGMDGTSNLGNGSSGIVLAFGASYNIIGDYHHGNYIANNDSCGVIILGNNTLHNRISANSIFDNAFLGIDILPEGVNINDVGDADNGPNGLQNYPIISSTGYNAATGYTFVTGTIDTQNKSNCTIEVFKVETADFFNHGQGKTFLGATNPDANGNWTIFVEGTQPTDIITTTATAMEGSTSEFSQNFSVVVGIHNQNVLESNFSIYPNPNNGSINCVFVANESDYYKIIITDLSGRKITTLIDNFYISGHYNLQFSLFDYKINQGNYILSLTKGTQVVNSKIISFIE